ncbi:MAG: disulfide bond formation protein B [Hyphomicrobiales bacterium]
MSSRLNALFILVFASLVLAGAWAFQLIGGYQPCALCLQQRLPYYLGIPVALLLVLGTGGFLSPKVQRLLFVALALIFAVSLFFAVRHAGVEWKWWLGPAGCGAGDLTSTIAPLGSVEADPDQIPVFCDEAALRVLGLSFAGWNAVASLALLVTAIKGALQRA